PTTTRSPSPTSATTRCWRSRPSSTRNCGTCSRNWRAGNEPPRPASDEQRKGRILNQERTMKFMLISYATKDWEAGKLPDPRLLAAIPKLYEELPKGAALIGTGGLAPTGLGAKVRVSGGTVEVTDGPFAETKEIVGGFAIVDVRSKEDAIAIARRFWQ